jgi:hypothetical protein
MFANHLLLASTVLLPTVSSNSLRARDASVNNVLIPGGKTNFAKDGVSAQWAAGYPKEWGSVNNHYQFNEPDPEDSFASAITPDEKYLEMPNGTHVKFVDLEKNSTTTIIALAMPERIRTWTLMLRPAPQSGHVVLSSGTSGGKYDVISATVRIRLPADLSPVGKHSVYPGEIGAITAQGKVASLSGYIYDLEGTETPSSLHTGQPNLTGMNFSPDGQRLASVSWHAGTADLWNVTSG